MLLLVVLLLQFVARHAALAPPQQPNSNWQPHPTHHVTFPPSTPFTPSPIPLPPSRVSSTLPAAAAPLSGQPGMPVVMRQS